MRHLWEVDHAYYSNEQNYFQGLRTVYDYPTWEAFLEENGDAVPAYNLLVRWDWCAIEFSNVYPVAEIHEVVDDKTLRETCDAINSSNTKFHALDLTRWQNAASDDFARRLPPEGRYAYAMQPLVSERCTYLREHTSGMRRVEHAELYEARREDGVCWYARGRYPGDPFISDDPEVRDGVLCLYWVRQRKGFYGVNHVRVCKNDEEAIKKYLVPRLNYLLRLWSPIVPEAVLVEHDALLEQFG